MATSTKDELFTADEALKNTLEGVRLELAREKERNLHFEQENEYLRELLIKFKVSLR